VFEIYARIMVVSSDSSTANIWIITNYQKRITLSGTHAA